MALFAVYIVALEICFTYQFTIMFYFTIFNTKIITNIKIVRIEFIKNENV